jgi:integrase
MSAQPSERSLLAAERELRRKPAGAQKAVSEGIYLRLDRAGQRRFHVRGRGTFTTWEEAEAARTTVEEEAEETTGAGASRSQIRKWTVADYAQVAWWPTVLELAPMTQVDYRRGLKDLLEHLGQVTLEQIETTPLLIDELKRKIAAAKTYPRKPGAEAIFHQAAADKPLKTLRAILSHAVDREILSRNPMAGVRFFNRRRTAAGSRDAPSHRPILQSEVKHPRTVIRTTVGMRGNPAELAERRIVPLLIATGMRPSDICAMRHFWWRDEDGPRDILHIDSAVKDVAGHLEEGEPKTGARDLYLFAFIAEELERIYQLQGCPSLDALTIPNTWGGLLDWGNWRTNVWYPTLHRAGIAKGPRSDSPGAFYPYRLRHVGVTVMLHAQRPQGGTYSEREVARQFGHTVATLDRVYADIPEDMHGIAGLTIDEIFRNARREVWGPAPGDPDYEEVEYDLLDAAALTGLTNTSLAGRITRGSLPGTKRKGKCYVTRYDLVWHGLLDPPSTRRTGA